MTSPDLFGCEAWLPFASLRPQPAPVALSLFDAAAESKALVTGRARSQERAEIVAPPGFSCLCGSILKNARADCPQGCR